MNVQVKLDSLLENNPKNKLTNPARRKACYLVFGLQFLFFFFVVCLCLCLLFTACVLVSLRFLETTRTGIESQVQTAVWTVSWSQAMSTNCKHDVRTLSDSRTLCGKACMESAPGQRTIFATQTPWRTAAYSRLHVRVYVAHVEHMMEKEKHARTGRPRIPYAH